MSSVGSDGAKERGWLGPDTLVSGERPTARDGMGIATVAGQRGRGDARLYIFGGTGPASSSGLGDMFRCADVARVLYGTIRRGHSMTLKSLHACGLILMIMMVRNESAFHQSCVKFVTELN